MFKYKGININYKEYGNKEKNTIVYLHGWGQNIEMMEPIANPFEKTHNLLIIELPGFGKSEEPKEIWSIEDYADMVHELIESLNITNPYMIGHSFGGKITLMYASKYQVNRIMLLASPYKKSNKKPSLKVRILKKMKNIPGLGKLADKMKSKLGSTDYKNASPTMRNILVKHVNTDIQDDIKKITAPSFIIWGTNDEAVPVNDAYDLEKLIKDSGLTIYEGCTHYAYLERLNQTISIIQSFMK